MGLELSEGEFDQSTGLRELTSCLLSEADRFGSCSCWASSAPILGVAVNWDRRRRGRLAGGSALRLRLPVSPDS